MQAGRINDVPDFLQEPLGHAVKADFQGLDNGRCWARICPLRSPAGRKISAVLIFALRAAPALCRATRAWSSPMISLGTINLESS